MYSNQFILLKMKLFIMYKIITECSEASSLDNGSLILS